MGVVFLVVVILGSFDVFDLAFVAFSKDRG